MTENNRNLILAVVLSAFVLLGWSFLSERFLPQPAKPVATAAPAARPATAAASAAPTASPAVQAAAPRIRIDTPRLTGSINLRGARIDDLVLRTYKQTIAANSPSVRLFAPSGGKGAFFAQYGWTGAGAPGSDALWAASSGTLSPGAPVTLTWDSPAGPRFEIVFAVDKDYMFTVTQTVVNRGNTPLSVRPYALISQTGGFHDKGDFNVHVGPLGVFDGRLKDSETSFDKLAKDGPQTFETTGGWLAITERYWLAALIPDQKVRVDVRFAAAPGDRYQADYIDRPFVVAPGASSSTTARLFAGAKEVDLIDRYKAEYNIPLFDRTISWGWFWFLAQPIFHLLDWLFRLTGNFGVAIICLTLIVRAAMFPIANRQYASMAKMRLVQPKMKALQERYKDDKVKQQQALMELYKTEKVNPLAGCLPILIQIPVFFALYKTLLLSIEMRHQPFALWIKDLSAPDPLLVTNLFGLLPFQPPSFLALGVLPLLLGLTMWVQQKLNPAPMDDIQKQVFSIMPWVFMFIMAPFAAGLQLYWTVNNLVSIAQQWLMMKRYPMPAAPAPAS